MRMHKLLFPFAFLSLLLAVQAAPISIFDGKSLEGWEGDNAVWRVEDGTIAAGKLDASKPIDGAVLVAAGVLRRQKDGVRLLGKGELTSKLTLTVYSASAAAKAAVEKAGGTLTLTKPEPVAAKEA